MKRFASIALSAAVGLGLVACSIDSGGEEPLTVLAQATPHAEILRYVDEQNPEYELDVKVISGGSEPNMSVANGSADANFYQHSPYLLDWNTQTGKNLVNIVGVHIEPMGMYSNSIDSIDQLKQGAKIATPNSPSDLARALILLEANGVIGLDQEIDPANVSKINLQSITDNPKDIEIVPVEDTLVIQSLSDESVAGVIVTSNFALEIGLNPSEDSVIAESPENNPYVNILAANEDAAKDPRIEKLAADLSSPETAEWIREKYSGSVIPVN